MTVQRTKAGMVTTHFQLVPRSKIRGPNLHAPIHFYFWCRARGAKFASNNRWVNELMTWFGQVIPRLSYPRQERIVYMSVYQKIVYDTHIFWILCFPKSPTQLRYLSYRGASFSIPCHQKSVSCFISHPTTPVSTSQSSLNLWPSIFASTLETWTSLGDVLQSV
jgi:hypothetical protein